MTNKHKKLKTAFKKILLNLVPHQLVRKVKKKLTPDYFLFGPSQKNIGEYIINENYNAFSLYEMEEQLGAEVVNGFKACVEEYTDHEGFLRKYVLRVEDCFIEPELGWAITSKTSKLVFDSISNNAWIETYHPNYFKFKKNKSHALQVKEAISINMLKGGENNYWHFLHDLLGQVTMAKKYIPRNIPFLISRELSEKQYFKQALKLSEFLGGLKWLIRDQYMHLQEAWFLQPAPNHIEQFLAVREVLGIADSHTSAGRKVFLTRNKKRIRYLGNKETIESIARDSGFEIVDTDLLSFPEQIKIFGETRYLIGIHGAGLTNILFRKNAPMSILELLPYDYIQPHYFWLAKGIGHTYSCQVGSASALNTSFNIDPVIFRKKVTELLTK